MSIESTMSPAAGSTSFINQLLLFRSAPIALKKTHAVNRDWSKSAAPLQTSRLPAAHQDSWSTSQQCSACAQCLSTSRVSQWPWRPHRPTGGLRRQPKLTEGPVPTSGPCRTGQPVHDTTRPWSRAENRTCTRPYEHIAIGGRLFFLAAK